MTSKHDGEEGSGSSGDSNGYQRWVLLVIAVAMTLLFLVMIRRFLVTVMLAGVFAGMTRPVYLGLSSRLRGRRKIASLSVVLGLLVLLVVPLGAFLGLVLGQAVEIARLASPWIGENLAQLSELNLWLERIPLVGSILPDWEELATRTGELVTRAAVFLIDNLAAATAGTVAVVLQVFVLLYAMYFFLMDGPSYLGRLLYYLPLKAEDEAKLIERFVSVTRATIKGSILVGLIQGGLAGAAFFLLGLPGAAFWTTLMAVLSVIPVLGSGLIWGPAAVILMSTGRLGAGIALALWGAVVVSTADNFLRPRFVGRDTKMPDMMVLLATFGGLYMFGLVGFIIGPIIAALFITAWDLYGVAFEEILPPPPQWADE